MNPNKVGRYGIVGVVSRGPDEDVLEGEQGSRRATIRVFHGKDREAILEDARRVAALSHANVAHQEVGLHDDEPFLAAEIVGESLPRWAAQDHGLPEQLLILEGVAAGLSHAHAHGVVHGRVTAERIAVGGDGVARIWGFGLRGAASESSAAAYTAPEVAEGGAPTALADVYSAGVVFYELLAGETPRGEAPLPLRDVRKDLPKDLADAIMACRERSADWRPKDLDYLLETVGRLRGTLKAPKLAAPKRLVAAAAPRARLEERRSSPPILPFAIGVVVFLGGAAALYLRGGSKAPVPLPTPSAPAPTPAAAAPSPVSVAPPSARPTPATAPGAATPTPTTLPAATRPSAPPQATPPPAQGAASPPATATPPPPTSTTLAPEPTPAPVTLSPATPPLAAGPAQIGAVSPPSLRRGQKTLVDVHGQGLYAGLGAALLRGGRPAEGLRVLQQRFVNANLVQVFIEVDASAAAGAYAVVLSDGQNVTNAVRVDVAK